MNLVLIERNKYTFFIGGKKYLEVQASAPIEASDLEGYRRDPKGLKKLIESAQESSDKPVDVDDMLLQAYIEYTEDRESKEKLVSSLEKLISELKKDL